MGTHHLCGSELGPGGVLQAEGVPADEAHTAEVPLVR
jgi:hypothetical protein